VETAQQINTNKYEYGIWGYECQACSQYQAHRVCMWQKGGPWQCGSMQGREGNTPTNLLASLWAQLYDQDIGKSCWLCLPEILLDRHIDRLTLKPCMY